MENEFLAPLEVSDTLIGLRFLKKLVLFILLFLLLLFFVNRYVGKKLEPTLNPALKSKYEEIIHPSVNADTIILGASIAEIGITPKHLEMIFPKVFNFGIQGGGPKFTKDWYEHFFKIYYQKPELILYAVDPLTLTQSRMFEQDSAYLPLPCFLKALANKNFSKRHLIMNRFPVVRLRDIFPSLFSKSKSDDIMIKKQYYKGYLPWRAKDFQIKSAELESNEAIKLEMGLKFLGEFCDLVKADGITMIFIGMPNFYPSSDQADKQKKIYQMIEQTALERGFSFINYNAKNEPLNTDPKFYSDSWHLNRLGAEEVSEILTHDLLRFVSRPTSESAYDKGNYLFVQKRYEDALSFYIKAIQQNPGDASIYCRMGETYFRLHQYSKAIESCKKAIQLDPEMENAYKISANIYSATGDYANALQMYAKSSSLDPDDPENYLALGVICYHLNHLDYAVKSFETAIQINPNYAYAYYNLGCVYQYKLRNNEKALESYEIALQYLNNFPQPYINMGLLYANLGNLKKALDCFQKGAELDDPLSAKNLAFTHYKLGNYSEAFKIAKTALRLSPDDPELHEGLKIIQSKVQFSTSSARKTSSEVKP